MLRQTTHVSLELFKKTFPNLKTVHAMHQPPPPSPPDNMPSAEDGKPALNWKGKKVGIKTIVYQPVTSGADIATYVSGLRQTTPARSVGILVIPDDLVVSETKNSLLPNAAKNNIPVFVQVLEFANMPPPNPSALGGYGIPGDVIGREAADYVEGVVWGGANPGVLPVEYLCYGLEWWVNKNVLPPYNPKFPDPYDGFTPIPVPPQGPAGRARAMVPGGKRKPAPRRRTPARVKARGGRRSKSGRKKK